MDNSFRKFFPFAKVDSFDGIATGIAASETKDRDGECMDYHAAVPEFKAWSAEVSKATNGKSLGNIREQHNPDSTAGKAIDIQFDDATKSVVITSKIVDPIAKMKLAEGVYTGYSIGGSYKKRYEKGGQQYYVPEIYEVSIVDMPCNPDAHFTAVKSDGTTELQKFKKTSGDVTEKFILAKKVDVAKNQELSDLLKVIGDAVKKFEAATGEEPEDEANNTHGDAQGETDTAVTPVSDHPEKCDCAGCKAKKAANGVVDNKGNVAKGVRYLVPDGQHLPVSDASGNLSPRLMGAAWAALHGGYRGNKYEGPDKDKALAELIRLYEQEKMETPGADKVASLQTMYKSLDDLEKATFESASGSSLAELSDSLDRVVKQLESLGETNMSETLDKAARKSLHEKCMKLKEHLDAHKSHHEAFHKAAHEHVDGIMKVIGGGPETAASDKPRVEEDDKQDAGASKALTAADLKEALVAIFKGVGDRENVESFNKSATTKAADNGSKGDNAVATPTAEEYRKAVLSPLGKEAKKVIAAQEEKWSNRLPSGRSR